MNADEVHTVLDALTDAGCAAWVSGGWGVDALAGRQTREHRDLDLAIPAEAEPAALETLARHGYRVETDWRPVRVEVTGPRGRVDLHPVAFDDDGHGVQQGLNGTAFHYPRECFVSGVITGRRVGCLSVAQQMSFHRGYPPRDVDRLDLALLRDLHAAEHRHRFGDRGTFAVEVGEGSSPTMRVVDLWAAGTWLTTDDNTVYLPSFLRFLRREADRVRRREVPSRPFPELRPEEIFHRLRDDGGERFWFLHWGETTDNLSSYAYLDGVDLVILIGFWRETHPYPEELGRVFVARMASQDFVAALEGTIGLLA